MTKGNNTQSTEYSPKITTCSCKVRTVILTAGSRIQWCIKWFAIQSVVDISKFDGICMYGIRMFYIFVAVYCVGITLMMTLLTIIFLTSFSCQHLLVRLRSIDKSGLLVIQYSEI